MVCCYSNPAAHAPSPAAVNASVSVTVSPQQYSLASMQSPTAIDGITSGPLSAYLIFKAGLSLTQLANADPQVGLSLNGSVAFVCLCELHLRTLCSPCMALRGHPPSCSQAYSTRPLAPGPNQVSWRRRLPFLSLLSPPHPTPPLRASRRGGLQPQSS